MFGLWRAWLNTKKELRTPRTFQKHDKGKDLLKLRNHSCSHIKFDFELTNEREQVNHGSSWDCQIIHHCLSPNILLFTKPLVIHPEFSSCQTSITIQISWHAHRNHWRKWLPFSHAIGSSDVTKCVVG